MAKQDRFNAVQREEQGQLRICVTDSTTPYFVPVFEGHAMLADLQADLLAKELERAQTIAARLNTGVDKPTAYDWRGFWRWDDRLRCENCAQTVTWQEVQTVGHVRRVGACCLQIVQQHLDGQHQVKA